MHLAADLDYVSRTLADLLRIPSPTGYAHRAVEYMAAEFQRLGVAVRHTRKGALLALLPGGSGSPRALAAHVDTLGGMVKEVKTGGRLRLTKIGGFNWHTVTGEYCTVHTLDGREYTGTVLPIRISTHVHGPKLGELKWEDDELEVRLDERVGDAAGVKALGIQVGDYVSWDPRTTVTPAGFIKSRHLDNKAAAAVFLGVAQAVQAHKLALPAPVHLFVSNYEEVGHGASAGIPAEVEELVAVDMAAVGQGQTSDEFSCTVCVKDSSGPYDCGLSRRLIELAREHSIAHQVDIYPYYGSDASAALRAGLEARTALIGPGVDASHAYERTHMDALRETARLILAYIQS